MDKQTTIVIDNTDGAVSISISSNKHLDINKLSKEEKYNILSILNFTQINLIKDFFKNMIDIPINTNFKN